MNIKKRFLSIFLLVSLLFSLTGCQKSSSTDYKSAITKNGFYFDTVVSISVYDQKDEALLDDCMDICKTYDALLSRTNPDSDISQLNNALANGQPGYTVSTDTAALIKDALDYYKKSDGAFDITLLPVSLLWDFTGKHPHVPDSSSLSSALQRVDAKKVSVTGDTVSAAPGQEIDLGGIAKGFIADKLKEYLEENGCKSGFINLGGNVLLVGSKGNEDFTVGLRYPYKDDNSIIARVKASDLSIVTSGCYERYFEENGQKYHHILDPKTGMPVENHLLSVTILSKSSTDGDALSTSCYVMGYKKAKKWIEKTPGVEAVFIFDDYSLASTSGVQIDKNQVITLTSPETVSASAASR